MPGRTRKNLRLAVVGASGRMGREVVALAPEAGFVLAAGLDQGRAWKVDPERVDVVVDFSLPEGLRRAVKWCLDYGKPLVSGTTGLTARDKIALQRAAREIPVLHAANMSMGIAVISAMLERFAALGDWDFHIDEVHHAQKRDKPSGTALMLDAELSRVLKRKLPRPNSVRGGGVPGIHQVWAMGLDEVVVLQHTAFNRRTFARGALRAARWLFDKGQAGLYDMTDLYKV